MIVTCLSLLRSNGRLFCHLVVTLSAKQQFNRPTERRKEKVCCSAQSAPRVKGRNPHLVEEGTRCLAAMGGDTATQIYGHTGTQQ
jgi:hypothetical protein